MKSDLQLLIIEECERLQTEIDESSLKMQLPQVCKELKELKIDLLQNNHDFDLNSFLKPFLSIISCNQSIDVITLIALTSLSVFINNNLIEKFDDICNVLINCKFQFTSDYHCQMISQRILACINSICDKGSLSEGTLKLLFTYLLEEVNLSNGSISILMNDTLNKLIRVIFSDNEFLELKEQCINSFFLLCDSNDYNLKYIGFDFLLNISRIDDSDNQTLICVVCVLLHQQLNNCEFINIFRISLQLFFRVFSKNFFSCFSIFIKCMEEITLFLQSNSTQNNFKIQILETITNFLSIPDFIFFLYFNCNSRKFFPSIFTQLIQEILKYDISRFSNLIFEPKTQLKIDDLIERYDSSYEDQLYESINKFSNKFNENPRFFAKEKKISSKELARLLLVSPGILRNSIGEFFSRNDSYCMETLENFLKLLDFSKLDFDSSIRLFLSAFQIAGEGQIVDRIFDYFSNQFYENHKDSNLYKSSEALHILSYAWLMIHTSFHNNNVLKKPKIEDFYCMLEKQNDGDNFDQNLLINIFNSIKHSKIPFEDSKQMDSIAYWRLQLQKQKYLFVNLIKTNEKAKITIDFKTKKEEYIKDIWKISIPIIYQIIKNKNNKNIYNIIKSCLSSITNDNDGIIDNLIFKISPSIISELTEENHSNSLDLLIYIIKNYGSFIKDGWENYLEIIISLFQFDLLPDEFLQFSNICDLSKPITLSYKLLSKSPSIFAMFKSRKVNSESDLTKYGNQSNEIREFILSTDLQNLYNQSKQFSFSSLSYLIKLIINKSNKFEQAINSFDLLNVALCVNLIAKLCQSNSKRITKEIIILIKKYYDRILTKESHILQLVQSITLNLIFALIINLWEEGKLRNCLISLLEEISINIFQNNMELIETGIKIFFDKSINTFFIKSINWKPLIAILSYGLRFNSSTIKDLFLRFTEAIPQNQVELNFDNFNLPIIKCFEILCDSDDNYENSFNEMCKFIKNDKFDSQNWRSTFTNVLIPMVSTNRWKKDHLLCGIKVLLDIFTFSLEKLIKIALFESIWFRILSILLTSIKRHKEFNSSLEKYIFSTLLKMKEINVFKDKSNRIYTMSRKNIEEEYPAFIAIIFE